MNHRIKEVIKERGYTVESFAASLGVTVQALYASLRSPSGATLEKFAASLGVELWELFADGREITAKYQQQEHEGGGVVCPQCGAHLEITIKN